MEEGRKIKIERPEGEEEDVRFSGTREGKPGKKTEIKAKVDPKKVKVESNPKLVFFVMVFMVGVTLIAWWGKRVPVAVSQLVSPKVVEVGPTGSGREVDKLGLREKIEGAIGSARGDYAVYVYDLSGRETLVSMKADIAMTAASLIKLPVMVAAFKESEDGDFDLDGVYTLRDTDKVTGAGSMAYASAGTKYGYRKLLELMGKQSDNTAFNVVVNTIGQGRVEKEIERIGMVNTDFDKNETSASDIGTLFKKLYDGELLNDKNTEEMLSFLTKTIYEERIPTGVPAGVRVAHKIGTEVGVISDGGVVLGEKPYVLVVMSEGAALEEGKKVIAEISRVVWRELGE